MRVGDAGSEIGVRNAIRHISAVISIAAFPDVTMAFNETIRICMTIASVPDVCWATIDDTGYWACDEFAATFVDMGRRCSSLSTLPRNGTFIAYTFLAPRDTGMPTSSTTRVSTTTVTTLPTTTKDIKEVFMDFLDLVSCFQVCLSLFSSDCLLIF